MTDHDDEPGPSVRTYAIVFATLMALLAATVAAAFVPWARVLPGHRWGVAVALTIAVVKALLILLYFMHVRYAPRMVWAFAGAGFLWLGILFVLTLSDYVTRNHPAGVSPKGEPRYLETATATPPDQTPQPFEHRP